MWGTAQTRTASPGGHALAWVIHVCFFEMGKRFDHRCVVPCTMDRAGINGARAANERMRFDAVQFNAVVHVLLEWTEVLG